MESSAAQDGGKTSGLSSAKREDIWALIIASVVMLASLFAPQQTYHVFKEMLFLF